MAPFAFAISVIGILIFSGLTAYDTQRIKNDYIIHAQAMDGEWLEKSAIMGALRLYLDAHAHGEYIDVLPESGRLVVFLSETFHHEVLPTRRERWSITGWFSRRAGH